MVLLLLQARSVQPYPAGRVQELISLVLNSGDDKKSDAAAKQLVGIFKRSGIPTTSDVGDEDAYNFVFILCTDSPTEFQRQLLDRAQAAARNQDIPPDAVAYCDARLRLDVIQTNAKKQRPQNPALRDQIDKLFKSDQAVRQKAGFNLDRMEKTDREDTAALEKIFQTYGVPTYRLVGPRAANEFVIMAQHQSPDFRRPMLAQLKANVDAGQADPGAYAKMFDRLQSDDGKKQIYGENLVCDAQNPKLHRGEIEDPEHVDERRATIGLMRLMLYEQFVIASLPEMCAK
jgi:hypothetical protein